MRELWPARATSTGGTYSKASARRAASTAWSTRCGCSALGSVQETYVGSCSPAHPHPLPHAQVWLHNFSDASVRDIYVEMGLLAASSCLFHTLSNFAGTAEAWRGPRCSIHHKVKRTGLGKCNLNLPSRAADQSVEDVLSPPCTVTEPLPPQRTYELALLVTTSHGRHERVRRLLGMLDEAAARLSSHVPPRLVVSDWEDGDRSGLVGMRWGSVGARRSLVGAMCLGSALAGRVQWLLVLCLRLR